MSNLQPPLRAKINAFVSGIKQNKFLTSNWFGFIAYGNILQYLIKHYNLFQKTNPQLTVGEKKYAGSIITESLVEWINEIDKSKKGNYKAVISGIWEFIAYLEKFDSDAYDKFWNTECKDLFHYLIQNYDSSKSSQKFINIYHFLNSYSHKSRSIIKFNFLLSDYKKMVCETYNVKEWKKNNKKDNWESQEAILNRLYDKWLDKKS